MSESRQGLTYAATGVSYDDMDPFKVACQVAAHHTAFALKRFGFNEEEASRGESAYLVSAPWGYMAHVQEGLGTKNIVADEMADLTGVCYYDQISQDTLAMIVNDLISLGALPITVAMHLAVGSSDWFQNEERWRALVRGWAHACNLARCTWSGGETPTLKDIIIPGRACLDGSAIGYIVEPRQPFGGHRIRSGDVIVCFTSSGIHANGLTLARRIAEKLPKGYLTVLPNRRMYGDVLLDPTHIYVGLVEDCLKLGADVHYGVNITGHGWRKFMRANEPFTYVIDALPPNPSPIFQFMMNHGPVDIEEAYGNLNMGACFALYVAPDDVSKVLVAAQGQPFQAYVAGHIEASDMKRVVINPLGIEFGGSTLAVR